MSRNIKIAIVSILALVVGVLCFWLSTHSYIEITVPDGFENEYTYVITESSANSTNKVIESSKNSIRVLVNKGDYQVVVTQDDKSYFSHVTTGGFLSTTNITAGLHIENSRSFKGDNPEGCVEGAGELIISWVCRHRLELLNYHSIATENSPSSKVSVHDFSDPEYIKSIFSVGNQSYALTHAFDIEEFYLLNQLNVQGSEITLSRKSILSDLSVQKDYRMLPYKSGVIAYSLDGSSFLYFENVDGTPETISQLTLNDNGMRLYSVSTRQDTIVATYNSIGSSEEADAIKVNYSDVVGEEAHGGELGTASGGGNSTVIIANNDRVISYSINGTPQQVRLCAEDLLCALEDKKLTVYKLQDKAEKLYSLGGVLQIEESAGNFYVINSTGVLVFNPDSREGYYQYSFGNYTFCGFKFVGNNSVICVDDNTDSSRSQHILQIDPKTPKQDNIDTQVYEIAQLAVVKSVAAYERYIHMSVDVGRLIPDENGELKRDPEYEKLTNQAIKNRINELGVDLNKYTIINPFD